MKLFVFDPIFQLQTDNPDVYAFRFSGHIDDDAAEAMASFMNSVFDEKDSVSMLLDLRGLTGKDWDTMLDANVMESRFRSLKHVAKYSLIGASDRGAKIISFFNKFISVEARAFDDDDAADAWAFVGANHLSR